MRDFRRSLIHLLVATCFMLFVAWVGLKLLQYKGNWELLLRDGQNLLEGVWRKAERYVEPVRTFLEPKVRDVIENAQDTLSGKLP